MHPGPPCGHRPVPACLAVLGTFTEAPLAECPTKCWPALGSRRIVWLRRKYQASVPQQPGVKALIVASILIVEDEPTDRVIMENIVEGLEAVPTVVEGS